MKKTLTLSLFLVVVFSLCPSAGFAFSSDCNGGLITHVSGYTIHTFLNSGTLDCTVSGSGTTQTLIVAGGGGGGHAYSGGGGAGGVIYNPTDSVSSQTIAVTVGSGGAGGTLGVSAQNGSNSSFNGQTANGGGFGGMGGIEGNSGGSGGGDSYSGTAGGGSGTSGQGFDGGTGIGNPDYNNGGGGGAGANGDNASITQSGNGGIGIADSSVGNLLSKSSSGVNGYIAGGGGGGSGDDNIAGSGGVGGGGVGAVGNNGATGTSGSTNSGSGGGGGDRNNGNGGNGGSGIVIISYLTPTSTPNVLGSGTINKIAKFTATSMIGDSLFSDGGSNITLTSGNFFMPLNSLFDTSSSGLLNFGISNATTMTFGRSGQKMIINSKVGIGTSTPTATLHVTGDIFADFMNVLANGLGLDTHTAGILSIGVTTSTAITIGHSNATTTVSGPLKITNLSTVSNCNSTATPATCGSAPSGSVSMSTGGSTLVVNTTAITANSQIFVFEDSSLGTRLGITCNLATGRNYSINARLPGVSFTIKSSNNPVTNKACLNYLIIN